MKYLFIYHDGNGDIRKKDLIVYDFNKKELENYLQDEEELLAYFPLDWIKKRWLKSE